MSLTLTEIFGWAPPTPYICIGKSVKVPIWDGRRKQLSSAFRETTRTSSTLSGSKAPSYEEVNDCPRNQPEQCMENIRKIDPSRDIKFRKFRGDTSDLSSGNLDPLQLSPLSLKRLSKDDGDNFSTPLEFETYLALKSTVQNSSTRDIPKEEYVRSILRKDSAVALDSDTRVPNSTKGLAEVMQDADRGPKLRQQHALKGDDQQAISSTGKLGKNAVQHDETLQQRIDKMTPELLSKFSINLGQNATETGARVDGTHLKRLERFGRNRSNKPEEITQRCSTTKEVLINHNTERNNAEGPYNLQKRRNTIYWAQDIDDSNPIDLDTVLQNRRRSRGPAFLSLSFQGYDESECDNSEGSGHQTHGGIYLRSGRRRSSRDKEKYL